MILLGLLFLSIPALVFLGIINSIVSGNRKKQIANERKLMKYNNPEAYRAMRTDERNERSSAFWLQIVAFIILIIILAIAAAHH